MIGKGIAEGAEVIVDGRGKSVKGFESGSFVHPTVLSGLHPQGEVIRTEIFGPVLGMVHLNTVEDAIDLVNGGQYGNMACLFTSSGSAAREVPPRCGCREYRDQHWSGRADGIFPIQRMEGQLFRHITWAG